MTQFEEKLNKLPGSFRKRISGIRDYYDLNITKKDNLWIMNYHSREHEYIILEVSHESLQAVVDTMLSELKKIRVSV